MFVQFFFGKFYCMKVYKDLNLYDVIVQFEIVVYDMGWILLEDDLIIICVFLF